MRRTRTRYHHGALRDAALEAGAREVDAHGVVGFSLERVAKSLGVTPAALYRHYKNRDDLLREVVWRTFLRYVEAVDAAALDPDAVDPLLSTGRAFVRFAVENPGWFRAQFSRTGARLSDRQEQARPRYAEVLWRELGHLFPGDARAAERWFLALWACLQGAAAMAVEHTLPHLTSDAERLAAADDQLATVLEGMRAAARRASRATRAKLARRPTAR